MNTFGDGLMVFRESMMDMDLAIQMLKEKDYSSFVMKRNCI